VRAFAPSSPPPAISGSALPARPNGSTWSAISRRAASSGWAATGINALPSAGTAGAGAIIYVPDAIGGSILAFSDGSNWRRSDDRSVIAVV
jgi:hypothetical protein